MRSVRLFMVNHARASLWLAMLPGFIGLIAGLGRFGSDAGLWLYALFVVWLLAAFFVINTTALRMTRPAMERLDRDCDPEPLLELSQTILRQNPNSLHFRVHEAYALSLLGRGEEALNAADQAGKQPRLWNTPHLLLMWSVCLPSGDPRQGEAEAKLRQAGSRLAPKDRQLLEDYLAQRQAIDRVTEGNQELEQDLLNRLASAGCPRELVGAHLALGAYRAVRGEAQAEEHLRYVLAHANKLRGAIVQTERLLCLLPVAAEHKDTL